MPDVKVEAWEDGDYIITVNGKPVGATLSELGARTVAEWFRRSNACGLVIASEDQTTDTTESEAPHD